MTRQWSLSGSEQRLHGRNKALGHRAPGKLRVGVSWAWRVEEFSGSRGVFREQEFLGNVNTDLKWSILVPV